MKHYVLWLDESGDFKPESQTDPHGSPSLVGGILLEDGAIPDSDLARVVSQGVIDPLDAHGMKFDDALKRTVMLPALQEVDRRGGRLVYFENSERLDDNSHRELYLKLLASGITQLAQKLGSEDMEFKLSIVIAQKGIPGEDLTSEERENHTIRPGYRTALLGTQEISRELRNYIKEEWEKGQFDIESRSRVDFVIRDARNDLRLKLADYASNARFARRSRAFSGIYREPLLDLFDKAYIFSFSVKTVENEINMDLAGGNLGSALTRLYTSRGELNHRQVLERIMRRFSGTSYRLGKLQLSAFTDDIVAYARNETDFEEVEVVLKLILKEVFEDNASNIAYQSDICEFKIRLFLIDMYLREGDLNAAGEELKRVRPVILNMNYRIENLKYLYFYNDKRALYYINCMDYEKAVETMNLSINAIRAIQDQLLDNDILFQYFGGDEKIPGLKEGTLHSEYLGDALCMKIYAEMFLLRFHPERYESIRQDTEDALSQYQFPGELERNQQYRAHVEMTHGNFREAVYWLLQTRGIEIEPNEDLLPWCSVYLNESLQEDPLSRTYYLMYYVEIMYEAARAREFALANELYEAVCRSKELYQLFFAAAPEEPVPDNRDTGNLVQSALQDTTQLYHPIEIVWWKWGAYLYLSQKDMRGGIRFMNQGADLCQRNRGGSKYLVMQVTGFAIMYEEISLILNRMLEHDLDGKIDPKHAQEIPRILANLYKYSKDLSRISAPEHIAKYIAEVADFARRMKDARTYSKAEAEEADRLSRMIAY